MKNFMMFVAVGVFCGVSGTAVAGRTDVDAGREMAKVVCAACHGPLGVSLVRHYPNLAGQKEQYLLATLRAYRSGERSSPKEMSPVAEMLTDQDIQNLAAYFSRLSPCGDGCTMVKNN